MRLGPDRYAPSKVLSTNIIAPFSSLVQIPLPVWSGRVALFSRELDDRFALLATDGKGLHDGAFIAFMYDLNLAGLSGHGNRTEDLRFGFISLQVCKRAISRLQKLGRSQDCARQEIARV